MVKLRLMRMGKTKQPTYRIVAADARSPRNGRFIEIVGTYQPRQDPSVIKIDTDKAVHWLKHGAQPTERVEKLLKVSGAWDVFKGLPEGTSGKAAPAAEPSPAPEPVTEVPAAESAGSTEATEATESTEKAPATQDTGEAQTDEGAKS